MFHAKHTPCSPSSFVVHPPFLKKNDLFNVSRETLRKKVNVFSLSMFRAKHRDRESRKQKIQKGRSPNSDFFKFNTK